MKPVNDLKNSLPFRFLSITIACLSMMAFAARSTNGAAYSAQRSATDEAREAIIKAKLALRAVKSLRIRAEWHFGDQRGTSFHPTASLLEFVLPDRFRQVGKDEETIRIGDAFYERRGDKPWKKITHEDSAIIRIPSPDADGAESIKRSKEVKFIGPDTLDNVPVLVYQYTVHDASGKSLLSTNKIWIGAQDGLPHRTEIAISDMASVIKIVLTYYDFNAGIVIEPPTLQTTEATIETKPQPVDDKQRQAVQQAAEAWLKLMDEGKTSESWEAAAQSLKAKVSKESWERRQRDFSEEAKKLGIASKSRKLKTAFFVKSLPSIRDQEGIVLVYGSTLENSGPEGERVELVLEQDQVWRVAMYKVIIAELGIATSSGSISLETISGSIPLERSPGSGGGIGSGSGTGMGPGSGFNTGGGNPRPNPNAPATTVDQKPIPLNTPSPRYTQAARNNGTQGTVRVRVLIGADGTVKQVRMVRGLPDGLEEEAIRAAYQLRFKPAMKDGKPVAFWQTVDIEFHLGRQ